MIGAQQGMYVVLTGGGNPQGSIERDVVRNGTYSILCGYLHIKPRDYTDFHKISVLIS